MASVRRPYLHNKCQHGRCPTLKHRYVFLVFVSSVAFLLWSPLHLLRGSLTEFVYDLKGDFSTLFTCKEDEPPPRSFNVDVGAQERAPPLIWSFPGSGDTWIRLLLEMASGIHTGSVYSDRDLMAALPGEVACNSSVLAVKAHPNSIPLDLITRSFEPGGKFYDSENGPLLDKWHDGEFFPERYPGTYEKNVIRTIENFATKCRGLTFTRAIVVVRDPYRALWSEYQRFYGWLTCPRGAPCPAHSFTISHTLFNSTHFKQHMLGFAQSWLMQWHEYQRFREEVPESRVTFVRYEDLLSPARRDAVLKRLIAFIDVPMVAPSAHCAFRWSRSTLMKRSYNNETINFMYAWMYDILGQDVGRLAEEFGSEVVGETAYLDDIGGYDGEMEYPFDPEVRARSESSLVCKVWRVLGTEAKAAGYKPPFGMKCLTPKRNSLFKNLRVDMLRAGS